MKMKIFQMSKTRAQSAEEYLKVMAYVAFFKNADLHYLTSIWSMPLNLYKVLLLFVDGPGKSHCPKVNMIK